MRVFVAINLPSDFFFSVKDYLAKWEELCKDFRWVYKESIHITLNFFSEIEDNRIELLKEIIEKSILDFHKIRFSIGNILYLPYGKYRRGEFTYQKKMNGLALEINKGKLELQNLSEKIENNLINIGKHNYYSFRQKENRQYLPHITIARKGRIPMEKCVSQIKDLPFVIEGVADNVTIFKSELYKGNPNRQHKEISIYTPIKVFSLE